MKMKKNNKLETFDEYLKEELKNPEFKKEYVALQPEYELISSILKARTERGLTQKDIAALTGIAQADISRIENGECNPTLATMQRIAMALGCTISISLRPIQTKL